MRVRLPIRVPLPIPIFVAALAGAPVAGCLSDEPGDATADLDTSDQELGGGQELPPGTPAGLDNPLGHVVLLEAPVTTASGAPGTARCSATRVGRRHFLTATHCLVKIPAGTPITISAGGTPIEVGTFSVHAPLTLAQDKQVDLVGEDFAAGADVALVTIDARASGYGSLDALQGQVPSWHIDDGTMMWPLLTQVTWAIGVPLAGYGLQSPDPMSNSDRVLRYGLADLIDWPSALGPPAKSKYFVTRGQAFDPGPTAALEDDRLGGPGVSILPGDSGGPALFGGVVGVLSRGIRKPGMTHEVNLIAIPDKAWTTRVMRQPVIDVVATSLDALDPTLERAGHKLDVYVGKDGLDVVYVKGHQLADAVWKIGSYELPLAAVEFLPDDELAQRLDLDLVKITLPADAPAMIGLLSAQSLDEAQHPDPERGPLGTWSARLVEVHTAPTVTWRRHSVFRALGCGDTYGELVGPCGGTPGMTQLSIVRSQVYQGNVGDQVVRVEKIEDVHQVTAWEATAVVNLVPDQPLEVGSYQYVTTSCNPNGSGCATIHIDYEYQDDEVVEHAGAMCWYHRRTFHDIVPWIYLLGERFVLSDLIEGLETALPGFEGAALGVHDDLDEPPAACDAVLAAHPETPPFTVADDGAIVLEAGWTRI